MKILGIETSCDETSVAIVEDGYKLHSMVVNSQIDIHKAFGGVVPEIAARSHIEVMVPVVEQALSEAAMTWTEIDAIAVTQGPGLLGSLLIGVLTARTLAWSLNKPLYPVHHILGHVYANYITEQAIGHEQLAMNHALAMNNDQIKAHRQSSITNISPTANRQSLTLPSAVPEFPILGLIVSGGHTQLMLFESHTKCQIIGKTLDDAVGEAFDKVAKVIGLPYPGGPSIEKTAKLGDPLKYKLPYAKLDSPYNFSFSGLKTATLRAVQTECGKTYDFPSFELAGLLNAQQVNNFAASFQHTAIQTLVKATKQAAQEFKPKTIILGGGVAASQALRDGLAKALDQPLHITDKQLCTDNAAMIAARGYFEAINREATDPKTLTVEPNMVIPTL